MSKTTVGNPATTPTAIPTTAACRALAPVARDDELDDERDDVPGYGHHNDHRNGGDHEGRRHQ